MSLPAKQWLAQRGYDPVYGARPLRRLMQQAIGDQLAKLLLAGEVTTATPFRSTSARTAIR